MTENAFAVHPYLIYAGITFFFMLLLGLLGAILRVGFQVGKIDGRLSGLETAVTDLRQDNANLRQEMAGLRQDNANLRQEMDGIRQEMNGIRQEMNDLRQEMNDLRQDNASIRQELGNLRGLLLALHERIDLVMRHRHDETGAVVLIPTESAPVAD